MYILVIVKNQCMIYYCVCVCMFSQVTLLCTWRLSPVMRTWFACCWILLVFRPMLRQTFRQEIRSTAVAWSVTFERGTDRPSCVSGLQSSTPGGSERTHGCGRAAAQPLWISAAPDWQTRMYLSASGRRTRTRGHGESPAGTGSGDQPHRHGEKKNLTCKEKSHKIISDVSHRQQWSQMVSEWMLVLVFCFSDVSIEEKDPCNLKYIFFRVSEVTSKVSQSMLRFPLLFLITKT